MHADNINLTCTCTTLTQRQLTNQEFHTVTDWSKEVSCPAFVLPEGVVYPTNIHTIIHLKNLLPCQQLTNSPMTTVLTTNRKKRFINTPFPWYHEFKWLRNLLRLKHTMIHKPIAKSSGNTNSTGTVLSWSGSRSPGPATETRLGEAEDQVKY